MLIIFFSLLILFFSLCSLHPPLIINQPNDSANNTVYQTHSLETKQTKNTRLIRLGQTRCNIVELSVPTARCLVPSADSRIGTLIV
jgi:hypothetical protein